jgi:DNA modification methylase
MMSDQNLTTSCREDRHPNLPLRMLSQPVPDGCGRGASPEDRLPMDWRRDGGAEAPITPFPTPDRQWFEILCGDARSLVGSLERQVQCVVTSPPYFQLKAYGDSDQEVGIEGDPSTYVQTLCDIFDAVPLHPQGSIWVNLRDKRTDGRLQAVPERFAIEMQERGWQFIDRVVWAKAGLARDGSTLGNYMVEPAAGRLNGNGWECLYRFSRSSRPWSDDLAVRIPRVNGDGSRYLPSERMELATALDGRVPPDVWLFGPDRGGAAHVAPMPGIVCEIPIALSCPLWVNRDQTLPERLVARAEYDDGRGARLMGKYNHCDLLIDGGPQRNDTGVPYVPRKPESLGWTPIDDDAEPGIVLDPFGGSGSTGVVALRLGRSFIGLELYERNCRMIEERCEAALRGLRAGVVEGTAMGEAA